MKKKPKLIVTFSDKQVSDSECKMAFIEYISIVARWQKNELLENYCSLSDKEKEELKCLQHDDYKFSKIFDDS